MMRRSALDLGTATSTMEGKVLVRFAKIETSPSELTCEVWLLRRLQQSGGVSIPDVQNLLRGSQAAAPERSCRIVESIPDALIALPQVVHASGAMPGKYVEGLFPRDGNR